MKKCDHIVGLSSSCGESWLTTWTRSGRDAHDLDDRFSFCPECGEDIRSLKLKRHYNHPKWSENVTPAMKKLGHDMVMNMLKKKPKLILPGSFPEGMGATVKTVTFERAFTTDK